MANSNAKPPKRKFTKSTSRHARGNKQKTSNYNMADARASICLPANASFTQVYSHTLQFGTNPSLPRSSTKRRAG
jgi:hypothetical protein